MIKEWVREAQDGKILLLNTPPGTGKTLKTIQAVIDDLVEKKRRGEEEKALFLFLNHNLAEEFYQRAQEYYAENYPAERERLKLKLLHLKGFDKIHQTECELDDREKKIVEVCRKNGIDYVNILRPIHMERLRQEGKVCPYFDTISKLGENDAVFTVHDFLNVYSVMSLGWNWVVVDENPLQKLISSFEIDQSDLERVEKGIDKLIKIFMSDSSLDEGAKYKIVRSIGRYRCIATGLKNFLKSFDEIRDGARAERIGENLHYPLTDKEVNEKLASLLVEKIGSEFLNHYLSENEVFFIFEADRILNLDLREDDPYILNYVDSLSYEFITKLIAFHNCMRNAKPNAFERLLGGLLKRVGIEQLEEYVFKPIPPAIIELLKNLDNVLIGCKGNNFEVVYGKDGGRKLAFRWLNNPLTKIEEKCVVCDASPITSYQILIPNEKLIVKRVKELYPHNIIQIVDAYFPLSTLRECDRRGISKFKSLIYEISQFSPIPKPSIIARKEVAEFIRERWPSSFDEVWHFWTLRGTNKLLNSKVLVVLGVPEPNPEEVWRLVNLLFGQYIPYERREDYKNNPYYQNEKLNAILKMLREDELVQAIERQRWLLGNEGKLCLVFTKLKLEIPTSTPIPQMRWREYKMLFVLSKLSNQKTYITYDELFNNLLNELGQLGWQDKKVTLPSVLEFLEDKKFIERNGTWGIVVLRNFSIFDLFNN